MNFHNASFRAAYGTSSQLPKSVNAEISFAGRSNVGKSSILNKLMYRKDLAKVSSQPGKTATINFYNVDGSDFVDLPGYGYAKVAKKEKYRWSELIEGYFSQERRFALVVCLIDIRHDASELDKQMVEFLQHRDLPFTIVFTKADKLSKSQGIRQAASLKKRFNVEDEGNFIITSSQKGTGIDELRKLIEHAIERAKLSQ